MRLIYVWTLLVAALPCAAAESTIISEDFDSYADTMALGGVWNLGDGTLDTANGNPGKSLNHPGTGANLTSANANTFGFSEVAPSGGETLIYSADIFDDASSANKRTTAGLRSAVGANIVEMGIYNAPSYYAYRVILFGAGDPNWVAFSNLVDNSGQPMNNQPVPGWHRFTAKITAAQIDLTLDLNADGHINATASVPISPTDLGFDIVRLGGPSNLSSAGGGVKFDNIRLSLVPEPATGLLVLLALTPLASRRISNGGKRREVKP